MIDIRFRPSPWPVASDGPASLASPTVERPLEPNPSRRGVVTRGLATFTEGASLRLLSSLRRRWDRLVAPRTLDAASLARRFESQLPNLAAELRYFARLDSVDEHRGGR